jgi:hypothetical protein
MGSHVTLGQHEQESGTTYHGILGPVGPHEQGPNETTGLPLRGKLSTDY